MFKDTANTGKKCILNAYDFKYSDISKRMKTPISWKQNLFFEKGQIYLQIVNPLHEKCTWPFKKLHGKQEMPYESRISASNRNNIKIQMNKCIGFWTSKCTKPAQGQKISKFWTSKCTKPAQGQKKQKLWTSKRTKPAQVQKKTHTKKKL